jgi:hemolysin activation/secretion protein
VLSVQYGRSKGVNPIINTFYAVPLNAYGTTVSAQYRKFSFAVQQDEFQALDIRNDAEIIGVSIRQPLYRRLQQEFAVVLTAEYEENSSSLLGQPFEFVAGATDGIFRIAPLRFSQEWVHRTDYQVVSAVSRFSLGVGALNATGRSTTPQSATARFFSWLGEVQWARRINILRTQLFARSIVQLSNEHLFPLEQIAVGGRYSVRGYREYSLVRDNALLASLEFRIPIFTTQTASIVSTSRRSWMSGDLGTPTWSLPTRRPWQALERGYSGLSPQESV